MASIFTYDPDPPRVASPWLRGVVSDSHQIQSRSSEPQDLADDVENTTLRDEEQISARVTRLEAEPQEGPVEYKLHLLLRPRRKFGYISTGNHIPGSKHSRFGNGQLNKVVSNSTYDNLSWSEPGTPSQASTQQTRQHRLQQLTTQLLWRLQQSSPHHSSSATNIILPSLPEALPELQAPQEPAKLLHGLEESHGALYEIGVSDDGTLIGLAEDEMRESLNNLRAMAACLGCTVEVLRSEDVGECEWVDEILIDGRKEQNCRTGKLVVVEAIVQPHLQPKSPALAAQNTEHQKHANSESTRINQLGPSSTEQLRVTMTGPTMSGKSTLLGTLTTSTLDNGRGKSRLSMLKHRHEISSGVTSSVTQELLGYQDASDGTVDVINYATENIASWIDIHVATDSSRLVLIADSAGHPRYRRTTVRSLVGCAPHWTLLCVSADENEAAAEKSVSDLDLSGMQLELCLRLSLPLVIVITKLDLASKAGLKNSLTRVLDVLKAAGRKPAILANSSGEVSAHELQHLEASAIDGAYKAALPLLNDAVGTVPIVLTSAVQGVGIANLHALLHELPIPTIFSAPPQKLGFVFHVEDVYVWPGELEGVVVAGRLRSGVLSVGDSGTLGPFSSVHDHEDSEDSDERPVRKPTASHLPTSRSFPGALRGLTPPHLHLPNQEWRRFRINSVRNLKLPVHSLQADQLGTIAIVPEPGAREFSRIRRGMVLTHVQPFGSRTIVAEFKREDLGSLAVGNHVVIYSASIRASAKVISARAPDSATIHSERDRRQSTNHNAFEFDDDIEPVQKEIIESEADFGNEQVAGAITAPNLLVTFSLDASKEFFVVGDQILVMPGGGPGLFGGHERGEKGIAGLEGFVGRITDTFA